MKRLSIWGKTVSLRLLMQERVTLRSAAFLFNKKFVDSASHAQRVCPELSCGATGTLTWITILSDFLEPIQNWVCFWSRPALRELSGRTLERNTTAWLRSILPHFFGATFSTNALPSPDGCCVFKRRHEKRLYSGQRRAKIRSGPSPPLHSASPLTAALTQVYFHGARQRFTWLMDWNCN